MGCKEQIVTIRDQLVETILKWERTFGFFSGQSGITAAVSEYDAAMLIGQTEAEYIASVRGRSSVSRGYDFVFKGQRIQVRANRPSGLPGSNVWNAGRKAGTGLWDILIYVLYDENYVIQAAYKFDHDTYHKIFSGKTSLRLEDMRRGEQLSLIPGRQVTG